MTSVFHSALDAEFLPDGRNVRLLSPLWYYSDTLNWMVIVPTGYVTDGASIPQACWSIMGGPFDGKYRRAAVVHDYLCTTEQFSWQQTHKTFYEAMLADGVGRLRAYSMYLAVRLFGPRWETQA